MTKEFDCFSIDGERYLTGDKKEAMQWLIDEKKLIVGNSYFLGKSKPPLPSSLFDVEDMLYQMQERAYDITEYAEDFPDLSEEKRKELETLVSKWLDENIEVNFFEVEDITQFKITEEDIKGVWR